MYVLHMSFSKKLFHIDRFELIIISFLVVTGTWRRMRQGRLGSMTLHYFGRDKNLR